MSDMIACFGRIPERKRRRGQGITGCRYFPKPWRTMRFDMVSQIVADYIVPTNYKQKASPEGRGRWSLFFNKKVTKSLFRLTTFAIMAGVKSAMPRLPGRLA